MTYASKAHSRVLMGIAALCCVGGLLWLKPWASPARQEVLDVVQRSSVVSTAAGSDGRALQGVDRSAERVAEQVSLTSPGAAQAGSTDRALEPEAQLIGQVLGRSGEPVAGATILATTSGSATSGQLTLGMELEERERRRVCSAESDGAGRFEVGVGEGIPELSEGRTVSLLVRAPGWVVKGQRLGRFPGPLPMVAEPVILDPAAVVSGRVIGPDGLAVEGAVVYFGQSASLGGLRVSAPSRGYRVGTTGADGAFRCDELGPGAFHLVVDKPGHPVASFEGVATVGRELEGVQVRLERGASISGLVDGGGRDPSSLWISIWPSGDRVLPVDRRPKGASPEADGSFELTGLRPGNDYILTLHSDRSATRRRGSGGERATASAGDRDVRLEWAPRATVRGRVVQRSGESSGAVSVEGFVLWHTLSPPKSDDFRGAALEVDGEVAASHADGRFVIDGLRIEPGSTRAMALRVRAPGFEQLVRTGIPVPHGVDVDLGEIELAPAPGLRVRVVEAGTQRPVEGARVFLAEETERKSLGRWRLRDTPAYASTKTRFAETDASGYAVLQLPKKRPLILFANADGFPAGEFLEVSGEEEVVLELNRGATVAAEVVDMNGNALEGVEVSMRIQRVEGVFGSPRRVARTDELGVALFEHVEAGGATVRVEPPRMRPRQPKGWRESSERVDVSEGEEVGVRLVMPMSSEVFGRVRLGGAPLSDARVRFAVMEGGKLLRSETTSGSLRAITDQDGEFSLRGVPTGTFEVTVSHRSRSMATVFTYEVRPDRSELIIELVETRVSGRVVVTETGEPARGVTVEVAGPSSLHRAWVGQRSMRENWQGGMDFSDDWIEPGKVVTGEDGTFQFSGITPGVPIELTASGELFRGWTEALGAFEDGEVREGVVLEVAAAATLRVFAENVDRRRRSRSSRLLDYGIRLRALEGRTRAKVVESFRGSSYKFTSLRPGRYSVETIDLKAEGYPAIEAREVTLGGGEQAEITMPGL